MPRLRSAALAVVLSVVATVAGVSLASPASATTAWSAPIDVGATDAINGVSCASSTFCVALDYPGNIRLFNGTTWSSGGSFPSTTQAYSVSCVSSTFCVATDGSKVHKYNGSTWDSATIATGTLFDVSCASTTFCAAVGEDATPYLFNGSTWAASSALSDTGIPWGQISCPSSTFCATLDFAGNVATFNGADWTVTAGIDDANFVSNLSCVSSTFCVAVDQDGNSNAGHVLQYNGSTWTEPELIDANGNLLDVACPSTTFCVAVDDKGATLEYNGTIWDAPEVEGSLGLLTAVTCPSTAFCMASDGTNDVITRGNTEFRADTTGPAVVFTSGPAANTKLTSASVAFTGVDPGRPEAAITFECQVDGAGSFAPCTSPQNLSSLSEGVHNLSVRATDESSNLGATAVRSWRVDTTAPTVNGSAVYVGTTSPKFTVSWSGADTGSGIHAFQIFLKDTNSGAVIMPATVVGQTSKTLSLTAGHGYLFTVNSIDRAGNLSATKSINLLSPTDDKAFSFSSGFARAYNIYDYMGSHAGSATPGSFSRFTFVGKSAVVGFIKSTTSGFADITVDGVRHPRIDLYNGTTAYRSPVTVFSSDTSGTHTVVITVVGNHRPGGHGSYVNVDMVTIGR